MIQGVRALSFGDDHDPLLGPGSDAGEPDSTLPASLSMALENLYNTLPVIPSCPDPRLEPVIIVYTMEEARRPYDRFSDFVTASFYIGMEYREPEGSGNVKLVRAEIYSAGDPDGLDGLKTFVNLLLDHAIDHEVKFLNEPPPMDNLELPSREMSEDEDAAPESREFGISQYEERIGELKEARRKGTLSKKEYKAQKDELLERWRSDVADRMSR